MPDAYALFGFPVHHSWSPFIHGLFARQTGQDMTYRLLESPPEQFRTTCSISSSSRAAAAATSRCRTSAPPPTSSTN